MDTNVFREHLMLKKERKMVLDKELMVIVKKVHDSFTFTLWFILFGLPGSRTWTLKIILILKKCEQIV